MSVDVERALTVIVTGLLDGTKAQRRVKQENRVVVPKSRKNEQQANRRKSTHKEKCGTSSSLRCNAMLQCNAGGRAMRWIGQHQVNSSFSLAA